MVNYPSLLLLQISGTLIIIMIMRLVNAVIRSQFQTDDLLSIVGWNVVKLPMANKHLVRAKVCFLKLLMIMRCRIVGIQIIIPITPTENALTKHLFQADQTMDLGSNVARKHMVAKPLGPVSVLSRS